MFGTQGIYALRGEAKKAQFPALVVSLVLLVVGGIAVFLHLQHWERIFNGFGHLTSGITQELIAIVDPVGRTRGISDATSLSAFGGSSLLLTVVAILCSAAAVFCAWKGKKDGGWKKWGIPPL